MSVSAKDTTTIYEALDRSGLGTTVISVSQNGQDIDKMIYAFNAKGKDFTDPIMGDQAPNFPISQISQIPKLPWFLESLSPPHEAHPDTFPN